MLELVLGLPLNEKELSLPNFSSRLVLSASLIKTVGVVLPLFVSFTISDPIVTVGFRLASMGLARLELKGGRGLELGLSLLLLM